MDKEMIEMVVELMATVMQANCNVILPQVDIVSFIQSVFSSQLLKELFQVVVMMFKE